MNQNDLNNLARKIIKENCYLTLGTADADVPWVAPVYYARDEKWNFYYISLLDSLHIKHILKNPRVAFAIFDSHQREGTGNGVQGSGKTYLLPEGELEEAFKWYHTTFVEMKPESFTGSAPYRFFKIIPDHFYVLDPDAKVDNRVNVYLLPE